jgi:hypothetical protein
VIFFEHQIYLFVFLLPAILLGVFAQYRVRSTYAEASRIGARMSGYAAARTILDAAGLHAVDVQQTSGHLDDHYSPREKLLRLSPEVFHGATLAAVGIAAHEAGHALQDAKRYAPLIVRNAAVPAAGLGDKIGGLLMVLGVIFSWPMLLLAGIAIFSAVLFFQVVNLPVEFDASARAKRQLVELGVVDQSEMPFVRRVLSAAALTYVAATMQTALTLLFYLLRFAGQSRDDS